MSRYVLVETLTSVAVNAAISAAFVFFIFGGKAEIGLWGPGGLALDFVPQTFMIAMMSVLVPTALTRRRIQAGAVRTRNCRRSRLPRRLAIRALLVAAVATLGLGGAAIAILAASCSGPLSFAALLGLKIGYGAIVASLVTPVALRAALSDGRLGDAA